IVVRKRAWHLLLPCNAHEMQVHSTCIPVHEHDLVVTQPLFRIKLPRRRPIHGHTPSRRRAVAAGTPPVRRKPASPADAPAAYESPGDRPRAPYPPPFPFAARSRQNSSPHPPPHPCFAPAPASPASFSRSAPAHLSARINLHVTIVVV